MIIEILLITSCIFLILVFFYKQAINEYTILQIEYSNLNKITELLNDRLPILVKDIQVPHCILPNTLLNIQRFTNLYIGSCSIKEYFNNVNCSIQVSKEFEIFLANETGFNAFIEHTWRPYFYTNPLCEYISSIQSKILFGSQPLVKTGAIYTMFMPIRGTYILSLISQEYSESIPTESCYSLESILGNKDKKQIQYIDVIVRSGNVLILPPHWYILAKEDSINSYMALVEYHEPMSLLNMYLGKK